MALSIDWSTKVITVPKADTTLIQSTPIEIRELDLDVFRLNLKNIEDSDEGIPFLDTHRHVAPISIGGIELARVIEIINGYTVTFEDGSYAVNLKGANSNVSDVLNLNNVQVRSANSAGLVQSSEIQFASFEGAIHIDPTSPTSGTLFPSGTAIAPVNNISDALLLANLRGIKTLFINNDITISSGDITNLTIQGRSLDTKITLENTATVGETVFIKCTVEGELNTSSAIHIHDCVILDLTAAHLHVLRSGLRGTITFNGSSKGLLIDCYDEIAGTGVPKIDMGGSGTDLVVRNYKGGLELTNKTGSDECSVEIHPGRLILDSTVGGTATIIVRGVGKIVDNGYTSPIDKRELLGTDFIAKVARSGV